MTSAQANQAYRDRCRVLAAHPLGKILRQVRLGCWRSALEFLISFRISCCRLAGRIPHVDAPMCAQMAYHRFRSRTGKTSEILSPMLRKSAVQLSLHPSSAYTESNPKGNRDLGPRNQISHLVLLDLLTSLLQDLRKRTHECETSTFGESGFSFAGH